jgi:hypothetical protein
VNGISNIYTISSTSPVSSSNTTLVNCFSDGSVFTLGPSSSFQIDYFLGWQSSGTTGGITLQLALNTTPVYMVTLYKIVNNSGTGGILSLATLANNVLIGNVTTVSAANTTYSIKIKSFIKTGAAGDSTLTLNFFKNNTGAFTTKIMTALGIVTVL